MKKAQINALYNDISFNLNNSTTAPALPLTPNFCITFDIWFLTVFSLIPRSSAISLVVLLIINCSNTSFSLFVKILVKKIIQLTNYEGFITFIIILSFYISI